MTRILLIALLCCAVSPAQAASVTFRPAPAGQQYQYIYVSDVIVDGDAARLNQALAEAARTGGHVAVILDSRGGDVDVSMAMGRSIRRYGAITYHGHCASSCVFAFLGGVQRYTTQQSGEKGSLIIHRPELGEAYVQHPTAFAGRMLNMLRDYMVEMTGSAALYEAMMTVPFGSPQPLSSAEAMRLGAVTAYYQP